MAEESGIPILPPDEGQILVPTPPDTPVTLPSITTPEPPTVTPPAGEPTDTPVETPAEPRGGVAGGGSDLSALAMLLVGLGLLALYLVMRDLLNWLLRLIWGAIGRGASAPQVDENALLQTLSNSVGSQLQGIDQDQGATWQKQAGIIARLGTVLRQLAHTLEAAVVRLDHQEHTTVKVQQQTTNVAVKLGPVIDVTNNTATKVHVTNERIDPEAQKFEHQIAGLATHLTDTIEPELERLRSAIPDLQKGHADLWDELSKHAQQIGLDGMIAAFSVASSYLGTQWTQCESTKTVGEAVCKTDPSIWRKLLGSSLDVLSIAELCTLVKLIIATGKNGDVLSILGFYASSVEELLTCTGASRAVALPTTGLTIPPEQPWAVLAPASV